MKLMVKNIITQIKYIFLLFSLCFLSSVITISIFFLVMYVSTSESFTTEFGYLFMAENNKMLLDPHIKNISSECQNEDSLQIIRCINNYFTNRFDYVAHDDGKVRTPTYMFNGGGVCRDSATFYCSALSTFNIKCRIIYVDNHVFNLIDLNDGKYCIIDQQLFYCF